MPSSRGFPADGGMVRTTTQVLCPNSFTFGKRICSMPFWASVCVLQRKAMNPYTGGVGNEPSY